MNLTLNNSLMGMSVGSCSVSFIGSMGRMRMVVVTLPLCCLLKMPRNRPSFVAITAACTGCSGNIAATVTWSIDSCTYSNISIAGIGIGIGTGTGTDSSSRIFISI